MGYMNRGLEAILWGLSATGVTPTAFRTLMRLCARVNGEEHRHDYDVWITHKKLSKEVEVSVPGLRRHLDELVEKGFIFRQAFHFDSGIQTANTYTLLINGHETMTKTGQKVAELIGDQSEHLGDHPRSPRCSPVITQVINGDHPIQPSNTTFEGQETPLTCGKGTPTVEKQDLFGSRNLPAVIETQPLDEWVRTEWGKLTEEIETLAKPRLWNDARRRAIQARAKDAQKAGFDPKEAFRQVFDAVRNSTFLRGEEPPTDKYPNPFRADLDFILRQSQFTKILEGGYRATRTAETHDLVTGRRFGPAEQAGRNAVRSVLAAGEQHGNRAFGGGNQGADGSGTGTGSPLRSAFDQYRDDAAGRS